MPHKSRQSKPAALAVEKKLPLDFLQNQCELRELYNGAIGIPYFDEAGNEMFVRNVIRQV
ncbi:MAG TPA: hypothetical protein VMF69_02200 [Gemmataceae bacterium]|nr:hypothetical protein [Gemmataceae bacterium]